MVSKLSGSFSASRTRRKIRVLIIDDSALVREVLRQVLESDPDIEIVGTVPDAAFAMRRVESLDPDVLTLDIEMPRMDGLSFLRELMRTHPMPVVMVSMHTRKGAAVTWKALELGAVDFVAKPSSGVRDGLKELGEELIRKVKVAVSARMRNQPSIRRPSWLQKEHEPVIAAAGSLVAIGASTGGPVALGHIFPQLPANMPPIVIVQHMPKGFTAPFAKRLNSISNLTVGEARDGEPLVRGHAYVAPADHHLEVERSSNGFVARISTGPRVRYQRPSVDVLFQSVAETVGDQAIGVLLTGMGDDGARGLLALRRAGAHTLAQDEETSAVYGMPRAAVALGAAEFVVPLDQIPDKIVSLLLSRKPVTEKAS